MPSVLRSTFPHTNTETRLVAVVAASAALPNPITSSEEGRFLDEAGNTLDSTTTADAMAVFAASGFASVFTTEWRA